MVLEFPFGLEKFRAFTVEEEKGKKRGRRRREEERKKKKKEEGRREVQEFKVWILVKDLYGIHVGLGIFQPLSLSICRLRKP